LTSQATNLALGRDIFYFAETILGVRLNRAQRRWFKRMVKDNGWNGWRKKRVIHVAANQCGKSLGVAIVILWATLYKIGLDFDNAESWSRAPYNWYHVSPTQQQSYIPYKSIELLVRGDHPAQVNGCKLPAGLIRFDKQEQYYEGFTTYAGATAQFRTTDEKAKALQGRVAHGISVDEAAFEDHLREVVNEVLMMRLISTGGPLIIVSTPNGINDFFELVQEVIDNGTRPEDADPDDQVWEDNDGALVVWSTVADNVGFGLTQGEVDRMEATLDPSTKEQQLRGAFLEPSEAFFTPSSVVTDIFVPYLPDEQVAIIGHKYVIYWDPSIASDPTACIGLDVTQEPWLGVYFRHYMRPPSVTELINDMTGVHHTYAGARDIRGKNQSYALTGFDATSMGGSILRQELSRINPLRPVDFAGPSKKVAVLTNLRAAMASRRVLLPKGWHRALRELMNYRLKDEKIQQDVVMALGGATYLASRGFSGEVSRPFSVHGRTVKVAR
jgi:hypothetical protein